MTVPSPRPQSRHAEPEELVAYRAHRLGEDEVEQLRDHLALCPECTELLLDLASFEEIEPRLGVVPVAPDREMVEAYAALMAVAEPRAAAEARLEAGSDVGFPSAGAAFEGVYRPLPWTRTVLPWVMAGSMAALALGLGVQTKRLALQAHQLRQAAQESRKNFAVRFYDDLGASRGASATSQDIDILITVSSGQRERFNTYQLEIEDLHGKVVESFPGLRPDETNRLTVRLDRSLVESEPKFVLYGEGPDGRRENLHLPQPGS